MEKQEHVEQRRKEARPPVKRPQRGAGKPSLRGHPRDEEDTRISKTLSWLLRHGAKSEGLYMRPDGYVRVQELLALPRMSSVDFMTLERLVQHDAKTRYHLLFEPRTENDPRSEAVWWIRANQGHSLKDVELQMSEITDAGQVPMAVHGTNFGAWNKIEKEGLSPMKRTHIHLAQSLSTAKGGTAGMRGGSQVFIQIDLDKALRAGIKFYLSANGVVLTKGDKNGYLLPEFFLRVTRTDGTPLPSWDRPRIAGSQSPLDGIAKVTSTLPSDGSTNNEPAKEDSVDRMSKDVSKALSIDISDVKSDADGTIEALGTMEIK